VNITQYSINVAKNHCKHFSRKDLSRKAVVEYFKSGVSSSLPVKVVAVEKWQY
jgi:hypothetical protein